MSQHQGFANLFIGRQGKILLIVTLAVMICISMASFAFRFYTLDQSSTKVAQLERSLNHLKATLNADSQRQFQIQKTIALIEKYNPALPAAAQYEIADEIDRMAIKYPNLTVNLICALITHESGLSWRPDIRSQSGGIGLMQIMPAAGVFLAADEGVVDLAGRNIVQSHSQYSSRLSPSVDADFALRARGRAGRVSRR